MDKSEASISLSLVPQVDNDPEDANLCNCQLSATSWFCLPLSDSQGICVPRKERIPYLGTEVGSPVHPPHPPSAA